jgi:hypothetical protein
MLPCQYLIVESSAASRKSNIDSGGQQRHFVQIKLCSHRIVTRPPFLQNKTSSAGAVAPVPFWREIPLSKLFANREWSLLKEGINTDSRDTRLQPDGYEAIFLLCSAFLTGLIEAPYEMRFPVLTTCCRRIPCLKPILFCAAPRAWPEARNWHANPRRIPLWRLAPLALRKLVEEQFSQKTNRSHSPCFALPNMPIYLKALEIT